LKWEFTGGKVEQGEDSIQALKGEIHEELQLEI
jgi:8-oxo-dGTP pyrophosphatase MutT (NUDIX family)